MYPNQTSSASSPCSSLKHLSLFANLASVPFVCPPSPPTDGYVPLGPQSNLQVAFDSSSSAWSIKIASKVAAAKAHVRSTQARAASTAGVSTAAAKPSSPVLSARAQNAVVARTKQVFQQAAASTCDGGCGDAPWYPYECVPCPEGYSVDFYGLTCGERCCWWMASMRVRSVPTPNILVPSAPRCMGLDFLWVMASEGAERTWDIPTFLFPKCSSVAMR
jgi:hypothetical protein